MPRAVPFAAPILLASMCLLHAPPAHAAGNFDGTYRGSQTTLRTNNSSSCANLTRDNVVIRVVDNGFTRNWGASRSGGDKITVKIAPDGNFKGEVTALSDRGSRHGTRSFEMHGRIAGGVLEAELGSNLCAVRMTLHKS